MAFNPFLSMNEAAAPIVSEALNPFSTPDADVDAIVGENPFAGSNPFADFGGYEPPVGDTVPIDLFGGPPPLVENAAFQAPTKPQDLALSPVLPPRLLPPETQHLILTVTGQMDLTSTHLLDRIPPTRTPSPVSVRDIHSPSPTPEFEMEEDPELLPQQQQQQTLPVDTNRSKPARPPPARPPPATRPPPPRPGPPPRPPQLQQQNDDINLFDAPIPTLFKPTKEAILSLYSAPKKEEVKEIDFLSDDIPASLSTAMDCSEPAPANLVFNSSPFENMESHKMDIGNAFEDSLASSVTASPFGESAAFVNAKPSPTSEVFAFAPETAFAAETPAPDPTTIDSSPFATDRDGSAIFIKSDGMTTDKSPLQNKDLPSTFDSMQNSNDRLFTTEASVFTSDAMSFPIDSSSFVANSTFATESIEHGSAQVVSAKPSESMIFTVDTVIPVTTNNSNSPFGETTETSNNEFLVFGSRRESEGNPFETTEEPESAPTWPATTDPMEPMTQDAFPAAANDTFDAFTAKFDSTVINHVETDPWGATAEAEAAEAGFESEAFDSFLNMQAPPPPPPSATPYAASRASPDSEHDNFSLVIRPKEEGGVQAAVPALAPPPKPVLEAMRPGPLDCEPPGPGPLDHEPPGPGPLPAAPGPGPRGPDSPPTPLFDDDVSMPLEPFPRTTYSGPGWDMQLRQPNKKKITGQRFWKKVFVRLVYQGDSPVVQLFNSATDKEPFQELPLQPCYSVSEVGAQQYDQFGKIFTVKLQYVFYKERPGVRPGQVTKAERLTNKLSAFAAYAIQGDYQGVKEFGSDLRKLGLPVEHAAQVSQLFKLGSLCHEDVVQFSSCVEEALFRLSAHRDRALAYKMEEVQLTAVDELYVEQDAEGAVLRQIARVRLFFLGFLNGMPDVEVGVNDLRRQGREVVGRHDILPVVTEEWIRVEDAQFHACVQPQAFHEAQLLRFRPPDACYVEVCRFRVRPPRNRELPLLLRAAWSVRGARVELRADVLVAGFASRALGQVPCEDVAIRFPVPESWIYLFRVEKHFRYGSVKSAHRRTGKIKGIERFLGAVETPQESLIEVTSGQAKYEHQHRAVVWRMPRLPKDGQGAYTTHNLVMRLALTSFDQVPAELAAHAHVSFSMPATQVSHVTVRSVSLPEHDGDPPEKYVRYLARHEYIVGIERTSGESPAPAYVAAARADPPAAAPAAAAAAAAAAAPAAAPSSDSDSD